MDSENLKLRIGQINVQGSKIPLFEIPVIREQLHLDILLLQDPYTTHFGATKSWRIPGLGLKPKIIPSNHTTKFYAAIVIFDQNIDVLAIPEFTREHMAVAEISTKDWALILVSAYFPPSLPLREFMKQLREVITTFRNHKIVIGMDANSKNEIWFSKRTDDRGLLLEELIAEKDLYILNEPGEPPTFAGPHGESNIDLTIANAKALGEVSSWHVLPGKVTSDHQLIIYEIQSSRKSTEKQEMKFLLRKANWEKCEDEIRKRLPKLEKDFVWKPGAEEIEKRVHRLSKALTAAMNVSIPRAKKTESTVPWWNDRLRILKKNLARARKRLQRSTADDRLAHKGIYRRKLKTYTDEIRKSKEKSWNQFVKDNFGKNAWGFVYKLFAEKLQISAVQGTSARGE
jgi:hypothetical protein